MHSFVCSVLFSRLILTANAQWYHIPGCFHYGITRTSVSNTSNAKPVIHPLLLPTHLFLWWPHNKMPLSPNHKSDWYACVHRILRYGTFHLGVWKIRPYREKTHSWPPSINTLAVIFAWNTSSDFSRPRKRLDCHSLNDLTQTCLHITLLTPLLQRFLLGMLTPTPTLAIHCLMRHANFKIPIFLLTP